MPGRAFWRWTLATGLAVGIYHFKETAVSQFSNAREGIPGEWSAAPARTVHSALADPLESPVRVTNRHEFMEWSTQILYGLPRVWDEKGSEAQFAHRLNEAALQIDWIADLIEQDEKWRMDGARFFSLCALDRDILPTLRGLCMKHWQRLYSVDS